MLELLLFYPIVTSLFWLIGSVIYFLIIERKLPLIPIKDMNPDDVITFIIPAYNESETIRDTVESIALLSYPYKEIIVVNDGSTDETAKILNDLNQEFTFNFINLEQNNGKANALNRAIKEAKGKYLMILDADTIIEDDAPYYMVQNFHKFKNIGAVTGNPRIRNKSTLLGKIQTVEYASIIGSIKRAQTINGFVNTISGVFTLFSKEAVEDVDGFDIDMITEDIAISWKLHFAGYNILYEPRALCWMLVPEKITGLFKQRIRWAQGGQEVLLRDTKKMFIVRNIAFWILYLEQILSIIWVFTILLFLIKAIASINLLDYYFYSYSLNLILYSAFILTFVNIIQFTVSLIIDSRYEKKNLFLLIYLAWYPVAYWLINATVTLFALPRALGRKKGEFATWISPDRGDIKK